MTDPIRAFIYVDDPSGAVGDKWEAVRWALIEALKPVSPAEGLALLGYVAGQIAALQKTLSFDFAVETVRVNLMAASAQVDAARDLNNLAGAKP